MPMACVRGPGHPDQVCDLVAAAIVEEYQRRDPGARVHIRVMGGHGAMFVTGEIASTADFDVSTVVKRVLGSAGVRDEMEPFIALETMNPAWALETGAREGGAVIGYATNETPERLPSYVVMARKAARLMETKRISDEDWFWLDADYEVTVERIEEKKYVTVVRAGHAEAKPLAEVRTAIHTLLTEAGIPGPIRINPAGEETRTGFAYRVGSSGRTHASAGLGSAIPSLVSGVGLHLLHPQNVGAWLVRAAARECVGQELGQAVMISVSWLPMETRPHHVRIRNERGDDLGQVVKPERFDLRSVPEAYLAPEFLWQSLQVGYKEIELPWEK